LDLVLSWPVRILVAGLLLFALVTDGAGYIYRFVNHYPMTGSVPGLPPNILGRDLFIHRGLDLAGGTHLTLQMSNFPAGQDPASVQQRTIDILQKRVNALGVNEPIIQGAGSSHDRIDVQLAGVSSSRAEQVIGQRNQLVITTWVKDPTITTGPWAGYRPQFTKMTADMLQSATSGLDPQGGSGYVVNFTFNGDGANIFAGLSTTAYNACTSTPGQCAESHITNWLDLSKEDIADWNNRANYLSLAFDPSCVPSPPARPYCGRLLSDPYMVQPITGGTGFIQSSTFTAASSKDLATSLNSGALPVLLTPIQSTDISASLGQDSVTRSLAAGLLGLTIVVIFMIAFYRLPGLLASLALLFYAAVVLAIFKAWPVTVTLAGGAGFILSVGMAVDANVLIFERFKEEMRAGRTIPAAVDAAVRRAWPAIRDSNIATLITSIILFASTNGSVQGFALTLAIGVAISMFSSIIVTHNLLAIVLNFGWARSSGVMGVARGRA
jgi:preprotein translocase subunit SecD